MASILFLSVVIFIVCDWLIYKINVDVLKIETQYLYKQSIYGSHHITNRYLYSPTGGISYFNVIQEALFLLQQTILLSQHLCLNTFIENNTCMYVKKW